MEDKAYRDLENDADLIDKRKEIPFPSFLFESMIMSYGLQSLAVKMCIQLTNGLKESTNDYPYGNLLTRMLGMSNPPLRLDEVRIVIRAHTFYKLVQLDWLAKMKKSQRTDITDENEFNLTTGGECCTFDILEQIKVAMAGESY